MKLFAALLFGALPAAIHRGKVGRLVTRASALENPLPSKTHLPFAMEVRSRAL